MGKRVLILIEGIGNMRLYVQTAQRLGLHPIALSANPARYDYLAADGIEAIRIDTGNFEALVRECSRLGATYDVAGITSPQESAYATVGKLCQYFGLPGPNPTSIERCCNKFVQRELLAEAGIPVPSYRLATDVKEVERSAGDIGFPVVLKPAVGIGSSGVRLCRNVDELAEQTTYLLGGKHIWRSSPRMLVEEFAQGPYYCADIMGNEVIGIYAGEFGLPPHFVLRELTLPAPLTDDEHERIVDVSRNCLRALGLGWGPTNIELRWTKRGPVVIEVNPRMPGTPSPQMIQFAFGVDLITEHIKLVIGDEWDLRRRHSQIAATQFLVPDCDGTLDWIDGDSQASVVPGVAEVKFYIGSDTPIVRKGDVWDWIGHVIAVSSNRARTKTILQHAVGLIEWSIIPFPAEKE